MVIDIITFLLQTDPWYNHRLFARRNPNEDRVPELCRSEIEIRSTPVRIECSQGRDANYSKIPFSLKSHCVPRARMEPRQSPSREIMVRKVPLWHFLNLQPKLFKGINRCSLLPTLGSPSSNFTQKFGNMGSMFMDCHIESNSGT
jgi:hypothetical protein